MAQGRKATDWFVDADSSELKLQAGLEELGLADQTEPIQRAVTVVQLQSHVVREMPIHHWCKSPELPAMNRGAVEVDVRESRHDFPRPRPTLEDGAQRRHLVEESAARVVDTRLACREPRHHHITAVDECVSARWRIGLQEVVLGAEQQ